MSTKAKTILLISVFSLFIIGSVFLYNYLKEQSAPLIFAEAMQGEVQTDDKIKAPDFTVYDTAGNEVMLSDMEGRPVVLNFWASWCPPCKSEMPYFNTTHAELGDEVQFMMVDLVDGARETIETGTAYIEQQGYSFPVFFDTGGEAGNAYGIRSIPTTIFIDRDGYIVTGIEGMLSEATLRKGIDTIR